MALQWSDPVETKPKPKRSPPAIPPPAYSKHDIVFVLGLAANRANTSFNLCEVINVGYRLQQREYVYFCRTIDTLLSVQTIIVCKNEYLRKPKFQPGIKLRVRDLDDLVNGVGVVSDWKVIVECLELVNGKFMYWIRIPGAGRKKGSLLLELEESKLEMMVAAATKRRKAT